MNWIYFALSAPIFFVIYQTLSKFLPQGLSVFLVNAYASLVGVIFMLIIHFLVANNKSLAIESKYMPIVLGIGLFISLGNFFIIKAFSLGAPQTMFTAIFNPLYIIYGVLFGIFFWHEKLNFYQICGLFLTISGVFITVYFKSTPQTTST